MPPSGCRVVRLLAVPGQRAEHMLPDAERPERDGSAGADDRVREHRGARAGARRVAPRRDRGPAGARRHAGSHRPAADRREPRARRARRAARRPARAAGDPECSSGYAERLAAPEHIFFNIASTASSSGSPSLVACGCALVFGFVPALQSSRVDLVSGHQRGRVTTWRLARTAAGRPRRGAGGRVAAASGRRGPGDAQPRRGAARQSRFRFEPRDRESSWTSSRTRTTRHAAGSSTATCWSGPRLDPASNPPRSRRTTRWRSSRRACSAWRSRATTRVAARTWRSCRTPSARTTSARFAFRLVAGREFEESDDETAVRRWRWSTHTLAQRFWGGAATAIGKRIRVGEGDWRTVIGVAADVKYLRINEAPRPYFYVPFLQSYRSGMILHTQRARARRSPGGPGASAESRRSIPICRSCTPRRWPNRPRGALIFFELTAAAMLFIFGVGGHGARRDGHLRAGVVHGQAEHARNRHPHGARRVGDGRSSQAFLGRGLRLGAIGAALGIAAALGLSRLLGSVLFGVSATDGVSFARALAIVLGGVVLATIVPAWRAARTNPLSALRHQ